MYGRMLSGVINCSNDVCMVVSRGVVSWGSFLSSDVVGRNKVAQRIPREVRRTELGPGLSPFSLLAMMTLVGWLCSV